MDGGEAGGTRGVSDLDDSLDMDAEPPEETLAEPHPRPKRRSGARRQAPGTASESPVVMQLNRPVSFTFIVQVSNMDQETMLKRLADLPPISGTGAANPSTTSAKWRSTS